MYSHGFDIFFRCLSRTRREKTIRPKISQNGFDSTEVERFEVLLDRSMPPVVSGTAVDLARLDVLLALPEPPRADLQRVLAPGAEDELDDAVGLLEELRLLRGPVWKSTSELGRRGQTSELSSSVKSMSIRLIFGRIDCSRQVLEAQPKSLCQNIRMRSH